MSIRWIDQGGLPAYRVGHRRLALRRNDVVEMIRLARDTTGQGSSDNGQPWLVPPLTPEDQARALAAVEAAKRLQAELLDRRGGEPFAPPHEILDALREERSQERS